MSTSFFFFLSYFFFLLSAFSRPSRFRELESEKERKREREKARPTPLPLFFLSDLLQLLEVDLGASSTPASSESSLGGFQRKEGKEKAKERRRQRIGGPSLLFFFLVLVRPFSSPLLFVAMFLQLLDVLMDAANLA